MSCVGSATDFSAVQVGWGLKRDQSYYKV